jgi:hypothetical protein
VTLKVSQRQNAFNNWEITLLTTFLLFALSFLVAVLSWRLIVTTNALLFLAGRSEHDFSVFRMRMSRDDQSPAETLSAMMAEAKRAKLRGGR